MLVQSPGVLQGKPPGSSRTLASSGVPGSGRIRLHWAVHAPSHCSHSITGPSKRRKEWRRSNFFWKWGSQAEEWVWWLHSGLGYIKGGWSGDLRRRNREVPLPSKDSPRAAGWCTGAALLMGVQAIGNGRVPEAEAVLWHRTQVWHCTLRTAVYMISHSLLVGLVCTLKIEFIGHCMWEKITNNWQLLTLPGTASKFL